MHSCIILKLPFVRHGRGPPPAAARWTSQLHWRPGASHGDDGGIACAGRGGWQRAISGRGACRKGVWAVLCPATAQLGGAEQEVRRPPRAPELQGSRSVTGVARRSWGHQAAPRPGAVSAARGPITSNGWQAPAGQSAIGWRLARWRGSASSCGRAARSAAACQSRSTGR